MAGAARWACPRLLGVDCVALPPQAYPLYLVACALWCCSFCLCGLDVPWGRGVVLYGRARCSCGLPVPALNQAAGAPTRHCHCGVCMSQPPSVSHVASK
jgi:hypothetical protein